MSIAYSKINLNETSRKNMQDDGFFNISQHSNHDVDNDVASIDSQTNSMDDDNGDDSPYLINCIILSLIINIR